MTYSVESAKAQFSQLLQKAANGEEVVIAEKDKPVARLVPVTNTASLCDLPAILSGIEHHLSKEEADNLANDIEEARRSFNAIPIRNPWES